MFVFYFIFNLFFVFLIRFDFYFLPQCSLTFKFSTSLINTISFLFLSRLFFIRFPFRFPSSAALLCKWLFVFRGELFTSSESNKEIKNKNTWTFVIVSSVRIFDYVLVSLRIPCVSCRPLLRSYYLRYFYWRLYFLVNAFHLLRHTHLTHGFQSFGYGDADTGTPLFGATVSGCRCYWR